MVEVAVNRTDAPPEESDVGEVGPFVAGGNRFVVRSAQSGLLSVVDDRMRDLRAPDRAPDRLGVSDGTGDRDGGAAGGDGGDGGDGGPVPRNTTVFHVARRGPAWLSHPWGIWRDGEPCETTVTDDYIVAYALWEVTRLVLERAAPLVPVHAAAVERDGVALVLVGPSHAGKSTLSAWLTRAGWRFLTDEVALLDVGPSGAVVHPFWRPVGVRRGGPLDDVIDVPGHEEEVLVPASRLGALSPPARLAAVVCPAHTPGAGSGPEPLSPAAALARVAPQLPDLATERAATVFQRVAGLLERVPAFALAVDDLDAAAAELRAVIEQAPAPAGGVGGRVTA